MLENLPAEAWRAQPPEGKGREIAAIVAHMHNVRVMWLKAAAKGSDIPEQLDRHTVTQSEASRALEQSHKALSAVLRSSLENNGQVQGFQAGCRGILRLPDRSRCASPRTNLHAGASGGTSAVEERDVRHVGMG
jgi:hypothetical protein